MAISLPFLVLVLIEVALRIAGLGGYPPTFHAAGTLNHGSTLVFTDKMGPASYFFANRSEGMTLDTAAFVMPKPSRTIRVMFVGESAAKGIPQPRPLRASAFLQAMLSDLWPDRTIEVINLGTPGIAAFPVLGILKESLDYQPDLVVAYLGNNEFYGAYGVASLHSAGRSPIMIRVIRAFHGTAIGQGIDRLMGRAASHTSKSMMETMIGQSYIGPDDPARPAAARNLQTFVADMIEACAARGVPLIVCTPPANERDMAPLGTADLTRLSAARAALSVDPKSAETMLRSALRICPDHPMAYHLLGHAMHAQENYSEANAAFRKAVDLDPMPWRPPASSVAGIRAALKGTPGVLADLEDAFRKASPGNSTGWELMDDHVHPSLKGQDLVARTIVQSMTNLKPPLATNPAQIGALPAWQTYATRLGRNIYEEYGVAFRMRALGSIPFFAHTNPMMKQRNEAFCARVEAASPPSVVEKLHAWADPQTNLIDRYPVSAAAAEAYFQSGDHSKAEPLYGFAAGAADPYSAWSLEFTYFSILCRKLAAISPEQNLRREAHEAIERGQFMLKNGRSTTGQIERFIGLLHQIRGEYIESIPILLEARTKVKPQFILDIDRALVDAYTHAGRSEMARNLVDAGIRAGGPAAEQYRRMISQPSKP